MKKASPKRKQQATKPAKATKKATKQAKQKQAKESLQERIRKAVESRSIYEELIEEGHERLLEEILFWEGRAA